MTAVTKLCFECKETKPAAEFYPHSSHKDGLSSRCRECTLADMHRRWRAKHPFVEWIMPTEKACSRCKRVQLLDQFIRLKDPTKAARDGYSSDCKSCRSAQASKWNKANPRRRTALASAYFARHTEERAEYELKRRLGVPKGTYARMLAEQDGKCAICGTADPGTRLTRFHFDHCHDLLVWRGLLCHRCNRGLGYFSHDPELLRKAANYLKLSPSSRV